MPNPAQKELDTRDLLLVWISLPVGGGDGKLTLGIMSAAAMAGFLALASPPASACNVHGNCNHGAPGPLAGAGLPFLALGYGAYWLIKRRRKAD